MLANRSLGVQGRQTPGARGRLDDCIRTMDIHAKASASADRIEASIEARVKAHTKWCDGLIERLIGDLQVADQPLDQAVAPLGVRLHAGLDAGLNSVRRRRRLCVDVHRADAVVESTSGAGRLAALHTEAAVRQHFVHTEAAVRQQVRDREVRPDSSVRVENCVCADEN